ncbi:MAG TPA: alkaline phosphatase family protein [Gaiellaceae bacterium]|nr:alkaline phosphatase family protein [Gaiellaceae bacterium]
MHRRIRLLTPVLIAAVAATVAATTHAGTTDHHDNPGARTTTPIQHLVVIYQENVSFDHYFATYPNAANPAGEPRFIAAGNTPSVNGLNDSLLAPNNPNSVQPFRLDRTQFETSDQDHAYKDEQAAYDHGLMDQFVEKVGRGTGPNGEVGGQVMGYFDGNTVTALWNYAQAFAMSDNSFSTTFGPSAPGALNLISGQTHGFTVDGNAVPAASQTVIGDPQPTGDTCDTRDHSASADPNNKNIGDLLNAKNITWGWFQGGFRETSGVTSTGATTTNTCLIGHKNLAGVFSNDYIPHHEPFQFFASTANPAHLPPSSIATIGKTDQANHQYDLSDFWTAVATGNEPAVSFLKAPGYQDGHAGYSDPLDEQQFLVETINRLERTRDWSNTAVVIAYDDSDGWYDHVMGPIVNQSQGVSGNDVLTGTTCGTRADPQRTLGAYQDRCGYGPRQPLLVVSPYAKSNFVDHSVTDQSSILRFIEDNWQTGRIGNSSFDSKAGSLLNLFSFRGDEGHDGPNMLFLDPQTGQKH